MTCRIDRIVIEKDLVVLRISGRLSGEGLDVLRAALEREEGAFAMDLEEVGVADRDAVKLLASRETTGIELRNCPPYIRDWIAAERAQANLDAPESDT
jgi:hypothetical protein